MMRFKRYITEMSYGPKDIPKSFYVAFDPEKALPHLMKGRMPGLKGISGSGEIEFDFFGVARDAMLVMPGKDVVRDNKLSRIMYDNPHYLIANDLEALHRIWNKEASRDRQQVFFSLFGYIEQAVGLRSKSDKKFAALYHDMQYYGYKNMSYDAEKKMGKIKNIHDLARKIHRMTEKEFTKKIGIHKSVEYGVKEKEYYKIVWDALLRIGQTYGGEAEWVTKSDTFIIPKGSELHIIFPSLSPEVERLARWMKKRGIEELRHGDEKTVPAARKAGFSQDAITWTSINGRYTLPDFLRKEEMVEKLGSKYKIIKRDYKSFQALKDKWIKKRYG